MSSNERSHRKSPPRGAVLCTVTAAALAACVLLGVPAEAALDLGALQVTGLRGQSAEQVRRDRYECHNWAVDQTDFVPSVATAGTPSEADRARRAERVERVLNGAAIGAGVGGLVRAAQDRDPVNGVLAGAAAGAAVAAATGRRANEPQLTERESHYLRALTACLEGRGYTVTSPARETAVAGAR